MPASKHANEGHDLLLKHFILHAAALPAEWLFGALVSAKEIVHRYVSGHCSNEQVRASCALLQALSASALLTVSGLAGLLCLTTAILTLALYSALAVTVLAGNVQLACAVSSLGRSQMSMVSRAPSICLKPVAESSYHFWMPCNHSRVCSSYPGQHWIWQTRPLEQGDRHVHIS